MHVFGRTEALEDEPIELQGFNSNVGNIITVSPDGRWLAAGEFSGGLLLWDLERPAAHPKTLKCGDEHGLCGKTVERIEFSPTGEWLAVGARGGSLQLWKVEHSAVGFERQTILESDDFDFQAMAFSPDNRWLCDSHS